MEEEHGERKSWRLKMAGEGSDDWAPPEAEVLVQDWTGGVRGQEEDGWEEEELEAVQCSERLGLGICRGEHTQWQEKQLRLSSEGREEVKETKLKNGEAGRRRAGGEVRRRWEVMGKG